MPGDFFKLKDLDKKEDRHDENINVLLQENGLYRKKLPKGPDSLMRAVSDALNFTSTQYKGIQESLLSHLTQLIASNKLTPRLNSFQGNSALLKDFANNPQLTGFDKTNLELVSLFYKVRIILYTMNEDHYLSATIYNHNYPNTIELLRAKNSHYEAVFPITFIKKAGVCQNILLNIIDKVIHGRSSPAKNINGDEYINVAYESSLLADSGSKDSTPDNFRITRGQHKKSLSDNFNTNFELMEEQQTKFLDAFMSAGPLDDYFKGLKTRKDTAESGFSINANFDFIDEQNLDPPFQTKEFAIKNYPMPSGRLSPRNIELDSPMPAFSKAKFSNHANVLYNENLSLAEIERLEKNVNAGNKQDPKQVAASPYYNRNVSPPGLSPATKFSQRTFTDAIQTPQSDFLNPSPSMSRDNTMQPMSPLYPYGGNSPSKQNVSPYPQQGFQNMGAEKPLFNPQPMSNQRMYPDPMMQPFAPQAQFSLHPQQYNSLYMKRVGNSGTSMAMPSQPSQGEEFNMGQGMGYEQGMPYDSGYDQSPGYEPGMEYDNFGQGHNASTGGTPMIREKKKPVILEESQERFVGRLKFFDENKKYGFIVMEDDGSDIFVHYDDLVKANITKDLLRTAKMGNVLRMTFGCMAYIGKYNKSRKAIDIQLMM